MKVQKRWTKTGIFMVLLFLLTETLQISFNAKPPILFRREPTVFPIMLTLSDWRTD